MDKQKDGKPGGVPKGLNKYEDVIIHFLWLIILAVLLSDMYSSHIMGKGVFHIRLFVVQGIIFILMVLVSVLRMVIGKKRRLEPGLLYFSMKFADILLVTLLVNSLRHGFAFCFVILIPIISICISRGFGVSLIYLGIGLFSQIVTRYLVLLLDMEIYPIFAQQNDREYYFFTVVFYLISIISLRIIGDYHNQFAQSELDNQCLVDQLGRRYAQLEAARKEKQDQYDKLKEVNLQLEETNKKLTSSLAEFFTLQQISSAISSIFDMNELLQFVNDIIIGVMGVSTSSIALYNGAGSGKLKVLVSNITNKKEQAILTDNINTPYLKEAVDQGRSVLNNAVDPDSYNFTKGRNIRSLLCVPLKIKGKSHGLVLIEHSIPGAFDDDNVRLLKIITQQVSIAIDNARLYEQLQESANTDGLTRVYNRVFFQNQLQNELKQAKQRGYEVSVVLYDIDNFKSFNDSYGHLFGDIVLKTLAQLVKESIRKDDFLARFGGEEFILLLPRTGKDLAFEKAEELRKKIAGFTIRNENIAASVTVSMGISTFPTLAQTERTLINSADEALYIAKSSGKNCVRTAKETL